MRGRILAVGHAMPTPDRDSGSASLLALLRVLARAAFAVTFVALRPDEPRYTRALNDLGIATPQIAHWVEIGRTVEALAPQADVVLLVVGEVATQFIDIPPRVAPRARIVFHPIDLHFLRMQRGADLLGDRPAGAAAGTTRAVELDVIARADATIVVSRYEAELLAGLVPRAVVHCVPIMRATPRPSFWRRLRALSRADGVAGGPDFAARRDIMFIGGYRHDPNIDAMLWFTSELWPRVLARGFTDGLVIAGAHVPGEIGALASDRIDVRGYVADLGRLFDASRVSIAPLRYGGGIKGKIVSSLSYGVPVVATAIAAEGMGLRDGEDILIADDPDLMAERIVALYRDAALWRRLARNGYATFLSTFSEQAVGAKLVAVFDGLMPRR